MGGMYKGNGSVFFVEGGGSSYILIKGLQGSRSGGGRGSDLVSNAAFA